MKIQLNKSILNFLLKFYAEKNVVFVKCECECYLVRKMFPLRHLILGVIDKIVTLRRICNMEEIFRGREECIFQLIGIFLSLLSRTARNIYLFIFICCSKKMCKKHCNNRKGYF